jgi:putative lipoprotein
MKTLSAFLVIVLAGCATVGGRDGAALGDANWRLFELDGSPALTSPDTIRSPYLRFDEREMRVSGAGGCNRLSGPYTRSESSLRFGALVMTRMACADSAMNRQESQFGVALQAVDRFEITGSTLTLYAGSSARARLRKGSAGSTD